MTDYNRLRALAEAATPPADAEAKLAAVRELAEAERTTGNEQTGINILAILDGGSDD